VAPPTPLRTLIGRWAAPGERRWTFIAVAAIAIGLVLRLVWVLVLHPPFEHLYSDMDGYVSRATRLVETGDLIRYDALSAPGTHFLLAAPLAIFGADRPGLWAAAALWGTLSSLTPLLMWRVAHMLFTPAAAALTAVFCALWPLHITSAGYFLSETPSLTFLVAALWAAYRAERSSGRVSLAFGAAAGLLSGGAIAIRPQFVLNVLVLAVPWIWAWRRRLGPLIAFSAAAAAVVGSVVVHNSAAAEKPTGISENSGLTFFLGHCDVLEVSTGRPPGPSFRFGAPVAFQRGTGRTYVFPDHLVWDQGFFFGKAADCIRDDGVGHVRILGRSLLDMTATTVLWPQWNEDGLREVVHYSNVVYSVLLPALVIGSLARIARRRREGKGAGGETAMLAHLACAFVLALVFFGEPRYRMPYDVFGLTLLAVLIAAWRFDSRTRTEPSRPRE
jgi:4-amino-4-deoxy-L-arabinose transferase-like glycosyltransferase